jgi:hypothetical protein
MNYQDYASQYGGAIEAIGGVLYDVVTYTSATTLNMNYFTTLRNNLGLSNMELAGTLASPKAFLVRAIRVDILQPPMSSARAAAGSVQPGAMDNIAQFLNSGILTLTIGAKQYAQFPLWMLPCGSGVWGVMASDGDVADPGEIQDYATNGYPQSWNVRTLSKPIFIGPQINFNVLINFPAVITTAGGVAVNIKVLLDGDLLRPVQ